VGAAAASTYYPAPYYSGYVCDPDDGVCIY
jgi:hypothetical protein